MITPRKRAGTGMRRRRWFVIALVFVLAAAGYFPLRNTMFAVHLMMAMRSLASGDSAEDLQVTMENVKRRRGSEALEALVYHPAGGKPVARAAVLVPGISELGCYHPRLMALSRSMAAKGFLVVTPDIRAFRAFRMSPEALDEIQFWFQQVQTLNGNNPANRIGLAGISFSGTLALIVAARPEIRERVAWVFAIGAYDNPMRCSRDWFAAGPVTVGQGYYPTRYYARWILMLAADDLISDNADRGILDTVLVDLLLQREVPSASRLRSKQAARYYRLATMRESEEDPELARCIEAHLKPLLYDRITPERAASEVRCPVFLVHGAEDDLIPPEESMRLCGRLGSKCSLLISPFLTHTHPNDKAVTKWRKAAAALEMFRFFYAFARTAG